MKKAAIALDRWKLPIFGRHLAHAGYAFETKPGVTPDSLIITVKTENLEALEVVVRAANTDAAKRRKLQ